MCPPGRLAPKPTLLPIFSDVSNMKRFLDNAALPCICSILKGFLNNGMPTPNHKSLAAILVEFLPAFQRVNFTNVGKM